MRPKPDRNPDVPDTRNLAESCPESLSNGQNPEPKHPGSGFRSGRPVPVTCLAIIAISGADLSYLCNNKPTPHEIRRQGDGGGGGGGDDGSGDRATAAAMTG